MQKILFAVTLCLLFLGSAQGSFAQCTPNANACVILPNENYGVMCYTPIQLPDGQVGHPYETFAYFVAKDSIPDPLSGGNQLFSKLEINQILNLPQGLQWETNSSNPNDPNGVYSPPNPGNGEGPYGCMRIYGTPQQEFSGLIEFVVTVNEVYTPDIIAALGISLKSPLTIEPGVFICSPNVAACSPAVGEMVCITPDPLPNGVQGQYYEQTLFFRFNNSFAPAGGVVNSVELQEILGLDPGLTFDAVSGNPSDITPNVFTPHGNSGPFGCIKISGVPQNAHEAPNNQINLRFKVNTLTPEAIDALGVDTEVELTITPNTTGFEGSIQGYVFDDKNANGVWESNEPKLEGVTVQLSPLGLSQLTDPNGVYLFGILGVGAYTLTVEPPAGYTQTFPANNAAQTVTLLPTNQDPDSVNFGLHIQSQDLKVELVGISPAVAAPGTDLTYTLRVTNNGEMELGGMLNFEKDEKLDLVSATPADYTLLTGGLLRWSFAPLQTNQTKDFSVVLAVPASLTNGQTLLSLARVEPLTGDANAEDNQILVRDTVEGNVARFQLANQMQGRLYPNPAKDRLALELQSLAAETVSMRLTNYAGQTVLEQNALLAVGENRLPLELPALPAGLYWFQLTTSGGVFRSPVVIQR